MQGELGRTRATGVLDSNEFGPDLSGKSFHQKELPGYFGDKGSTTDKGILFPTDKIIQNRPDINQVYQLQDKVMKNLRHEIGASDSDEEQFYAKYSWSATTCAYSCTTSIKCLRCYYGSI